MIDKQDKIKLDGRIYHTNNMDEFGLLYGQNNSWRNDIELFLRNWFDDTDYISTHTSGSTGEPKEIRLSKKAMRNSAEMTNAFFGLDKSKNALLCMPAAYIAGKMMLVRAIVGGFNLIATEPKANPFLNLNAEIDFTAITPYQLTNSAETLKTARVKNIIVGGGHVSEKHEALASEIPAKMYETYGMTETASHIALRCFNGAGKAECFTVLDGVTIRQDARGCLVVLAPHITDCELVTNDIVQIVASNSFRWLGRADNVINSAGVKIFPEEVEKKLENFIPHRFMIGSLYDEVLENKVVLLIEAAEFDYEFENEMRKHMSACLRKYEIPKEIHYIPRFVCSASDKVLRKETMKLLKP